MGDGGDELVLQSVEFGAVGELKGVLKMLFPGLRELIGEVPIGTLRSEERD